MYKNFLLFLQFLPQYEIYLRNEQAELTKHYTPTDKHVFLKFYNSCSDVYTYIQKKINNFQKLYTLLIFHTYIKTAVMKLYYFERNT